MKEEHEDGEHRGDASMLCADYERWLDDGMPEGGLSRTARAHAATCARCASSLAAAHEIDRFLAAPATRAPERLTDSVMARVLAIESVRAEQAREAVVPGSFVFSREQAWWVRAAAQPAAALAFTLAALVLWQRDTLNIHANAMVANASGMLTRAFTNGLGIASVPGLPEAFAKPEVMLGFAIAIAPVLAWTSASLWSWAERRV